MEASNIVLWVLGVVCTVLGWFARELYTATQSLRKDISELQVQMNRDFIRYDRLQDALKPIVDSLHEIKQTLAGKADK